MAQLNIQTPRRSAPEGPAVRRITRLGIPAPSFERFPWRIISGGLMLAIIIAGIIVFANRKFYVTHAEIGGVRYVPAEEIYTTSGIAGYHILWVDPDVVAKRVSESPSIDSAEVSVLWPARVLIVVKEREPAIIWEQAGIPYWVDVRGNLMLMRESIPSLVRVINEGDAIPYECPGSPECTDENAITIDAKLILGTQHLKTLRDSIEVLYYDPSRGLSFQDERGWRAYFGVGTNMDHKFVIYNELVTTLLDRGYQIEYVDVGNPEAPFYRIEQ